MTGGPVWLPAPLLILSSGIQLVVHVQEPDGTVVAPVLFTALTALWALGMVCVAVTVRAVAARHAAAGRPLARAGRIGVRSALVGCGLQVAFAVGAAVTAALSGKPLEAVFLLFALGFLALIVGAVMLGTAVRRAGVLTRAARGRCGSAAAVGAGRDRRARRPLARRGAVRLRRHRGSAWEPPCCGAVADAGLAAEPARAVA